MRFDFLTPEIFDMLILANLALGVLLITWRFYQDMTRKPPVREQRQQVHDESSQNFLDDTDANPVLAKEDKKQAKS